MCIPRDEELEIKSIVLMDQIYRNASAVIAIDSSLETIGGYQPGIEFSCVSDLSDCGVALVVD